MGVFHQPMFHGIVPTIGDVVLVVGLIPNVMFPKPSLPNAALASCNMAGPSMRHRHCARKPRLDHLHPRRKIPIALWQGPHTMHVIGQDDPRIDLKWPLRPRLPDSCPQALDTVHQCARSALRKRDGQKQAGTGQAGTNVIRHGQFLPNQG